MWRRPKTPEQRSNAVLSAADKRASRLSLPELAEWFDAGQMAVGVHFDQWRKGGQIEELLLAVAVQSVLAEHLRDRMLVLEELSSTSSEKSRERKSRRRARS